jgi:hypothetical protein
VTSSDDVLSSAIVPVGCCESLHTGLSNILRGFAAIVQDLRKPDRNSIHSIRSADVAHGDAGRSNSECTARMSEIAMLRQLMQGACLVRHRQTSRFVVTESRKKARCS